MEFICTAILFDLDGVLVDSSTVVKRHWKNWADSHGVSFDRLMDIAHGRTSAEIIRLMAPQLDAELEGRRREAVEGVDTDGLKVFDSVCDLLQSLPPDRWAVVTSGVQLTAATRLGFGNFPDPPVLVTAEDVRRGKPDPEAYLLAARRLGVSPEQCVVVEDAPAGIDAAKAAGMRVIAVATTHDPGDLRTADVVAPAIAYVEVTAQGSRLRVNVDRSLTFD